MKENEIKKYGKRAVESINKLKELGISYLQFEDSSVLDLYQNNTSLLKQENKQLKELCDKYEEEHNTTFNEWSLGLRGQIELQQRIDKALEYIKQHSISDDIDTFGETEYQLYKILKGEENE